jgi:superfamily II DNA or RNA helicase
MARLAHQTDAVAALVAALQAHHRATAVMACGSGKTAVGVWTANDLNVKKVVVLVPTLALIRQTRNEWLDRSEKPIEYICVCSDRTVEDDARVLVADLPVVDDADGIRRFLRHPSDKVKVIFSTYQSAHRLKEADASVDLIIFDEAHKTTGVEDKPFAIGLSNENIRARHRLFMTATPRHYSIRRDAEDEKLVYSMDNEEVYGPIAYTLSFVEAVRRSIIVDYKVVICVITEAELSAECSRHKGSTGTALAQIAVRKAMEKYPINKAITFHGSVLQARRFVEEPLPGIDTFHVNGMMTIQERHEQIDSFKRSTKAVISNARCLTEGVDIPVADLVVFTSPRRSLVDIVQAAGRAMRVAPDKELGFVLIPVLVENEEVLEDALKETKYDYLWEILRALQEMDESLADVVTELSIEKSGGAVESRRARRQKLDILGRIAEDSFDVACVTRIGNSDAEIVASYAAYLAAGGASAVISRSNRELSRKCKQLRWKRRHGLLATPIIRHLDRLGFSWKVTADDVKEWYAERRRALNSRRLTQYLEYVQRVGGPNGSGAQKVKPLEAWASRMRIYTARGTLDPITEAELRERGFYDVQISSRTAGRQRVLLPSDRQHLEESIRCIRSLRDDAVVLGAIPQLNKTTYRWLGRQREKFKAGTLPSEIQERLQGAGYSLDEPMKAFRVNCTVEALIRHVTAHGTPCRPKRDRVTAICHNLRNGHYRISKEQRRRLTEAGFLWKLKVNSVNGRIRLTTHIKNEISRMFARGSPTMDVARRFGLKIPLVERLKEEMT